MTALFYAALHYVEAHLATVGAPNGTHVTTHGQRNRIMSMDRFLADLFVSYKELQDRSQDARYNLVEFTPAFVVRLREHEYAMVRSRIRTQLGLSG